MISLLLFVVISINDAYGVEFSDDGTILISGNPDLTSYIIPATTVTLKDGSESVNCFGGCKKMTCISFEKGSKLEIIGSYSFYSTNIVSIDLSPCTRLNSIGKFAFSRSKLSSIIFSDSIQILDYSFTSCKLVEVLLPKNLKIIKYQTFSNNALLEKVVFPPECTVHTIESESFMNCAIKTIIIPSSVSSLGAAFINCPLENLSVNFSSIYFKSMNNVIFSTDMSIIIIAAQSITEYTCPNTVKIIGDNAFRETHLTRINFTENLTTINYFSFWNTNITSIEIPASVKSIGSRSFTYCYNLETVILHCNASLPYGVFELCTALQSIKIPRGVESIGQNCFRGCSELNWIWIPNTVKTISGGAFTNINKTCNITFENGSDFIIDGDLLYSAGYKILTAYFGFSETKTKYIRSETEEFASSVFVSSSISEVLFPNGSSLNKIGAEAFQSSTIEHFECPDGVTSISDNAFGYCTKLTSISFSPNLESIGTLSFRNCWELQKVEFGSMLTKLGNKCFMGTTALQSIKFGTDCILESIGESAFEGSGVKSITLPRNISSSGPYVFKSSKLATITAGRGSEITEIFDYMFAGCAELTDVSFGESLTKLSVGCFMGCTKLTDFVLPIGVTAISKWSFKDCLNLSMFQIQAGSSIESVSGMSFDGCVKLKKLKVPPNDNFVFDEDCLIDTGKNRLLLHLAAADDEFIEVPKGIVEIGMYSFQGSERMKSVVLPEGVTTIGIFAFDGCSGLRSLILPSSLKQIHLSAFNGCGSLGCDSVVFDGALYQDLVEAGISEEALKPCPSIAFTIFGDVKSTNKVMLGAVIVFSEDKDD